MYIHTYIVYIYVHKGLGVAHLFPATCQNWLEKPLGGSWNFLHANQWGCLGFWHLEFLLRRRWLTYIHMYLHTYAHIYLATYVCMYVQTVTRKHEMFAEALVRSSKSGTKIECMIHWLIFGAILGPSWGYLGAIVGPTYIGHLGLSWARSVAGEAWANARR